MLVVPAHGLHEQPVHHHAVCGPAHLTDQRPLLPLLSGAIEVLLVAVGVLDYKVEAELVNGEVVLAGVVL